MAKNSPEGPLNDLRKAAFLSEYCGLKGFIQRSPERIAWDSCIVIDCLEKKAGADSPYVSILPLVKEAEADKLEVVVSTLAIAETFFVRGKSPEEQIRIIDEFFDYTWVLPEASGVAIGKIARNLRRSYPIDGIDSIHLATALSSGAPVFLTYDGTARKRNKTPFATTRQPAVGERDATAPYTYTRAAPGHAVVHQLAPSRAESGHAIAARPGRRGHTATGR